MKYIKTVFHETFLPSICFCAFMYLLAMGLTKEPAKLNEIAILVGTVVVASLIHLAAIDIKARIKRLRGL